jgi:tetratricopeptide (TPR) repeat protein
MKLETERGNLRAIDPLTKKEGPALIATLRTGIEQFPDAPQALGWRNRLAGELVEADRFKEAADVLEELGARNPNASNDLYFRLGELYERRLQDPAKAKESYAKVPAGSPRYNDAQKKLKQK